MKDYFFDTCALQHRYIDSEYSRRVRLLTSRRDVKCYISEWTVAEIASTFALHCRKQSLSVAKFDALIRRFLEDVASSRLTVVATPKRGFVRAQQLFRFAGVQKSLGLGTGDSLIAMCAMEVARMEQRRVHFMTSDWKLFNIIRRLDAFQSVCGCELLGRPKDGSSAVA